MTLIDLFRNFYAVSVEKKYPVSAKILYFTLLGEWNKRFWRDEEIDFDYRKLSELSGLSKSAVGEAVQYLANRGHIKTFKPKRLSGATIFRLVIPDLTPTTRKQAKLFYNTFLKE